MVFYQEETGKSYYLTGNEKPKKLKKYFQTSP
jgi:hypothetical protein